MAHGSTITAPHMHHGIEIVQTDPGMWIWSDEETGAADIAHSLAEARAQIDAALNNQGARV